MPAFIEQPFKQAHAGCLALAVLAATGQAHAQAGASGHAPLLRALNAARQQGCE